MTFSGELPSSEEEQEEVERWAAYIQCIYFVYTLRSFLHSGVVRSILGMYGVSMDLDESQVEIDEVYIIICVLSLINIFICSSARVV